MNEHFDQIIGSDWLTRQDREDFSRFVKVYCMYIESHFGEFLWQDEQFAHFCKQNKIQPKGAKSKAKQRNHFWFYASKPNGKPENDFAHHFMRHIRNAFAHGLIDVKYEGRRRQKFYVLKDFEIHGEQSMSGIIRSDFLWKMIWLLWESRNKHK